MPPKTGKLKCKRKCLNGGICSRVFGNRCKCPPGYRGRYCQKRKYKKKPCFIGFILYFPLTLQRNVRVDAKMVERVLLQTLVNANPDLRVSIVNDVSLLW